MKKFIVETSDDGTEEKLRGLLYLGNESERADAVGYMLNIVSVTESTEVTYGHPRMTDAQRNKFWELCGRYGVAFREDDYRPSFGGNTDRFPMYEGWVGGKFYSDEKSGGQKTIYVGVERDGRSHS